MYFGLLDVPLGRSAQFLLKRNVAKARNTRDLARAKAAARFFLDMPKSGIDFDAYVDLLRKTR